MAKVDPVCGMEGRFTAHGEVFCSTYCLGEYEAQKNLNAVEPAKIRRWGPQRILQTAAYSGFALALSLGLFWPPLAQLQQALWHYCILVFPPFGIGLILAAAIDVFVPAEFISSYLGRGGFSDVIKGGLLGFAASSCSHGCLALSVELYKKGASPAAFISFLMASPWASLPTTILLIRLFGYKGLAIVGLAFVVALITGIGMLIAWRQGWIESNPNLRMASGKKPSELLVESWRAAMNPAQFLGRFAGALRHLAGMTLPWVVLGILLSSTAGALLPHWIFGYLGAGKLGPLAALASASAVEVCSEGSSPVAFEIYKQTGALGSAFVFLEAGVITDITELSLVSATAGKKTAVAMVILAVPMALALGYALNVV